MDRVEEVGGAELGLLEKVIFKANFLLLLDVLVDVEGLRRRGFFIARVHLLNRGSLIDKLLLKLMLEILALVLIDPKEVLLRFLLDDRL